MSQRVLLVLLSLASVGAILLVALNVFRKDVHSSTPQPVLRGGAVMEDILSPPVLLAAPEFELIDQSAESFGTRQLKGKVWIANFVFTRCAGPCPVMTSHMAALQFELAGHPQWNDIRLLSISVDPDYDTPAVLAERARIALADPEHWRWLTGARQQVWTLISEGFKLPVGEDAANPDMPILHSQKFVLVDRRGNIRGYYDALTEYGREDLTRHLQQVLDEQ